MKILKREMTFAYLFFLVIVFNLFIFFGSLQNLSLNSASITGYVSAESKMIVYDGEYGSAPLSSQNCLYYASEAAGAGVIGNALKLSPDRWHNSNYKLYCGGKLRRDLDRKSVV